jgi:hypothetical protein
MSVKFGFWHEWNYRLRVLENRAMRKMVGAKGKEVTGDWRKLRLRMYMN